MVLFTLCDEPYLNYVFFFFSGKLVFHFVRFRKRRIMDIKNIYIRQEKTRLPHHTSQLTTTSGHWGTSMRSLLNVGSNRPLFLVPQSVFCIN